jgi:L-amino acid N-acyltransferase YncA
MTLVRLATDADFTAIARLTNHWIRTTAIHFGTEDIDADELRSQWRETGDVHPWLVGEVDGAFAGYAKSGSWRSRAAYRWTPETTVYVEPQFHGRGIGRAVYGRLLAVLRAQGYHSAIGGIALPNDASVRLHEALGFEHVGTVRDAGWKFGRWHDVGFWQLRWNDTAGPLLPVRDAFAATADD